MDGSKRKRKWCARNEKHYSKHKWSAASKSAAVPRHAECEFAHPVLSRQHSQKRLGRRSVFGPEQVQSSDTGKTLGGSSEPREFPRRRDKPLAFSSGETGYCIDRQPAFQDGEISPVDVPEVMRRMATAKASTTQYALQPDVNASGTGVNQTQQVPTAHDKQTDLARR